MYRHCGTNNRAPRWTFTDPCKPEVCPGAREESASPAWLAAPAMNARDTTKVYIWRLDTGCVLDISRKRGLMLIFDKIQMHISLQQDVLAFIFIYQKVVFL